MKAEENVERSEVRQGGLDIQQVVNVLNQLNQTLKKLDQRMPLPAYEAAGTQSVLHASKDLFKVEAKMLEIRAGLGLLLPTKIIPDTSSINVVQSAT